MRTFKEFQYICERSLSKCEKDRKEGIAKGMKKNASDFKDRYGGNWKGVMYATATKMAKKSKCNKDVKEFWNPLAKAKPKAKPAVKKKNSNVLAYKNYKPGVLNKDTGKFTPRSHTDAEAKRYGWKPVKTSSYGPRDTTSQAYNTGKDNVQRTADGTPFTGSTRGVAVPYKFKKNEVPKGVWAGTPSRKFGSDVTFTNKPLGNAPGKTKTVTTKVRDTGNFGAAGEVNKSTSFDLMRQTARDLSGNQKLTPTQWGKRTVYVRNN